MCYLQSDQGSAPEIHRRQTEQRIQRQIRAGNNRHAREPATPKAHLGI